MTTSNDIPIISSSLSSRTTSPVRVLSERSIKCHDPAAISPYTSTNDGIWDLGPFDELVSPSVPIVVIYVYSRPPTTPAHEFLPTDRLEEALKRTLDFYPHLTGRLRLFDTEDGAPVIHRLGEGAGLTLAESDDELSDLFVRDNKDYKEDDVLPPSSIFSLPEDGNALLPPFQPWPEAIQEAPLLAVQHTRFACGGVGLGVRLHHIVCDAEGLASFVQDLAEVYNNLGQGKTEGEVLGRKPGVRSFLAGVKQGEEDGFEPQYFSLLPEPPRDQEKAEDVAAQLAETTLEDGKQVEGPGTDADQEEDEVDPSAYVPTPVVGKFIQFSRQRLETLKLETSAASSSGKGWISTFEALTAYLFRAIYRARLKAREDGVITTPMSETDILTPVNMRWKLDSEDLPKGYFPNALFCLSTEVPKEVLKNGSTGDVARCLHDMLAVDPTELVDEAKKSMYWVAGQKDKQRIRHVFRFGTGSLMISQWNKLRMYERAEFDGVPPRLVGTPFTMISEIDGLAYVLPVGTTGAVDVAVALEDAVWERLQWD